MQPSAGAELIELRPIPGDRLLSVWHSPTIAIGARAGQYVHVRGIEPGGLLRRRPLPIVTTDPATGTLTLHVPGPPLERGWLGGCRPGDHVDMLGALGRPFEVDPRSRHLLLIAEGPAVGAVRLLADEALRTGRQVTLLLGARSTADVYPSTLLPDEVEYVVATGDGSLGHHGSVLDLVPAYEAWADQAFAAGSIALLAALTRMAAGRRGRLGVATLGRKRGAGRAAAPGSTEARRKAWLQVVLEPVIGCAAGTCLGCVVSGTDGPVRACREGPVFAADELALESPA